MEDEEAQMLRDCKKEIEDLVWYKEQSGSSSETYSFQSRIRILDVALFPESKFTLSGSLIGQVTSEENWWIKGRVYLEHELNRFHLSRIDFRLETGKIAKVFRHSKIINSKPPYNRRRVKNSILGPHKNFYLKGDNGNYAYEVYDIDFCTYESFIACLLLEWNLTCKSKNFQNPFKEVW